MILRGQRAGKIAEVYEIWDTRRQVRLRLSEEEREAVADIFDDYEVLKIKQPSETIESTCAVSAAGGSPPPPQGTK
jgi:hypothetical protein